MNVLSLFDGISCAKVALNNTSLTVNKYFRSEIDDDADKISYYNHKDTINLGDVRTIQIPQNNIIDILIGGSPCQDLSKSKKNRKGLNGERSGLFWEYNRILKETKPTYFILENVAGMPKESKDIISNELQVNPIEINASLVSAQNRNRLFWTNLKVTPPIDLQIKLKDIVEKLPNKYSSLSMVSHPNSGKNGLIQLGYIGNNSRKNRVYSENGKSACLMSSRFRDALYQIDGGIRELSILEQERLQGLPDHYTLCIKSKNKRKKSIGNGFHTKVIEHILGFIT